jgi:hypothetical protein
LVLGPKQKSVSCLFGIKEKGEKNGIDVLSQELELNKRNCSTKRK